MSNTDTSARRGGLPEDDALASAFAGATKRRRRGGRTDEANKDKQQAGVEEPRREEPAEPSVSSTASPQAPIPEQPQATDPVPAVEEAPAPAAEQVPAPAPAAEQVEEQVVQEPQEAPAAAAGQVEHRELAVVAPPAPAPAPVVPRPMPDLGIRREGPSEQRITQCTVNVSVSVRDRFAAYQLAKKLERGSDPTNAVVVRRAVLHARKNDLFGQMLEAVRHRQAPLDEEDDDPEGLFGDVQGRRVERGRGRDIAQQSFRPSYEELAVIDAFVTAYGFENRSEFLDAALDAFLPPLPSERRRRS